MRCCVAPAAAVFATLALAALPACRVLPLKTEKTTSTDASRSSFDAAAFVKPIWESRVLPYFHDKATDLKLVLDGMATDYPGTAAKYGRRLGDANGPVSFAVKGSGTVKAINTESRAGTMAVTVDSASGPRDVTLQIGPVVRGNAIRDSLPFVNFQDFTNQIEFAQAGRALTDQAMAGIKPVVPTLAVGQGVSFSGGMTMTSASDPIMITPVVLAAGAKP